MIITASTQVETVHPLRHIFNPIVQKLESHTPIPKFILDATGDFTVTTVRTTSPCCNACELHLFKFSTFGSIRMNQNFSITLPNSTTCDSRECRHLIQSNLWNSKLRLDTPLTDAVHYRSAMTRHKSYFFTSQ